MNRPTGYSHITYGEMITDRKRMSAYSSALERLIRPGCVVLDIGSGPGVFALLACRFGAGHVHCVEPDDSIEVAKILAKSNGYADRMSFHQCVSTDLQLDGPADVVVSDLRGVLPLFENHIPSIVDARQRLLAVGGKLLPWRDQLFISLIDDADSYRRFVGAWSNYEQDLDLSAARLQAVNTWSKTDARAEQLLVQPRRWLSIDYTTVESTDARGVVSWVAEKPGTTHGIVVWFDTELAPGIQFSNHPASERLIYGQAFFPLEKPIQIEVGDKIEVELKATLSADGYVWQWKTQVWDGAESTNVKANYHQSTFLAKTISTQTLERKSPIFKPTLNDDGIADRFILDCMNGKTEIEKIAALVAERFPDRFPNRRAASSRVQELSTKYST